MQNADSHSLQTKQYTLHSLILPQKCYKHDFYIVHIRKLILLFLEALAIYHRIPVISLQ